MASAPPFVCPRAKLRSLPRGSPAAGLATVTPSAKARARGSADLMNFYATSYAVAYGQSRFRPCLGRHTVTGYVSNNRWDMSCLLHAAEGRCQDAARSTTAEHFQPLMLPDGRSLLPRHVHQPGSGYLQASSLSCLRTGTASPQHLPLLQGPPNAPRERGTGGRRAGPAQPGYRPGPQAVPSTVTPDVLQKTTVGTKEQSGFTRATPRSDSVLPGQPLAVSVTATDYLPSVHSHGVETLPVLPTGSERGSGFSREVPSCLATAGLPAVGHPLPLVSRGLRAPRVTQASLLGQQVVGRMVGASVALSLSPYPCPRHPSDHAPNPPPSPRSRRGSPLTTTSTSHPCPPPRQPSAGGVQPGRRDPRGASSPSAPAASAPTTTPPGWGTSSATPPCR